MAFLKFLRNKVRSVVTSNNIEALKQVFSNNFGSDLKALKARLGIVESLPSCRGTRRYRTKDGDIISICSGDKLKIINDTALQQIRNGEKIKDGKFVAMIRSYDNVHYPNFYKEGKGSVILDRDTIFYSYKKGAESVRLDNIGDYPLKDRWLFSSRDMSVEKATRMGLIDRARKIYGGWNTSINRAILGV